MLGSATNSGGDEWAKELPSGAHCEVLESFAFFSSTSTNVDRSPLGPPPLSVSWIGTTSM